MALGDCAPPPSATLGALFYVMVDSVAATLDAIVANKGEIVQAIGADAPEINCEVPRPGRKRDRLVPAACVIGGASIGVKPGQGGAAQQVR